eukprot:321292-Amphidinium_carterae.2
MPDCLYVRYGFSPPGRTACIDWSEYTWSQSSPHPGPVFSYGLLCDMLSTQVDGQTFSVYG